ncbi:50S ribosomal protein L29 [Candidatus Kaiserbacteria bacterium]|nr:50S ribosomal protein L29 [Candidatus Kaiserbacteria bacterium]
MSKKLDLKNHSADELAKLVHDKREELRVLRFHVAGSKNRDVKAAQKLRKDIARALTQANAPSNKLGASK